MSPSIFNSALGRALCRRPLSSHALANFCSILPYYARASPDPDVSASPKIRRVQSLGKDRSAAIVRHVRAGGESLLPETVDTVQTRIRHVRSAGGVRMFLHGRWPDLLTLLREAGVDIRGYAPGKTTLTKVPPLMAVSERKKARSGPRVVFRNRRARYSLKAITAMFIHFCNTIGGFQRGGEKDLEVVERVFTQPVRFYLEQKRCLPEDVMAWAWVLMAKDGVRAGMRLEALVRCGRDGRRRLEIPPFVVLMTLLRQRLHRRTLQTLFPIVEGLFSPSNDLRIQDSKTTIVLSIRLMRHLRESWPEELPRVIDIFIKNFDPGPSEALPAWVTNTFNRLLLLFSLPTPDGPYRNIPLLQECQFALVQRMAALKAPITREGYRAIIAVQMAHPKTYQETEQVRHMSKNWPPWQELRDGWVAAHRSAYGGVLSRGGQVIQQMMESGYSLKDWEREAMVLTGTDTDTSPTIQTRSLFRHAILSKQVTPSTNSRCIWAARVRATRTIEEAWNNFQECRAAHGVPHPDVWTEMFEKTVFAKKLQRRTRAEDELRKRLQGRTYVTRSDLVLDSLVDRRTSVVPGDGKELMHPPLNPRDGIFNAEPPPRLEDLFSMFLSDGLKPGNILTALLVREAATPTFAAKVLKHWNAEQAQLLLSPLYDLNPRPNSATTRRRLNPKILTSFLSHLCDTHAIQKALRLLHHHKPNYRPAWTTVLCCIVAGLNPKQPLHVHREKARQLWSLFQEMRALVDVDTTALRLLAIAAERWTTLSLGEEARWDGVPPPEMMAKVFYRYLCILPSSSAPPMIWPEPAMLHAFVRALGFARRYNQLEEVVRYMDRCGMPLETPVGRRVLIAVRVFLEGAGYGVAEVGGGGWEGIERLGEVVERWGGWGGEREVEEYLVLAGMVRGRRREEMEGGVAEGVVESGEGDALTSGDVVVMKFAKV